MKKISKIFFCVVVVLSIVFYFLWKGDYVQKNKKYENISTKFNYDKISDKLYYLEVIGLGVALDKYRQGEIWDMLKKGSPYSTIIDSDPQNYPWSGSEKMTTAGDREGRSLENALLDTPRYWGIPAFNAACRFRDNRFEDRPERPQAGIVSGMWDMHILIIEHRELSERPDRIFEKIFNFFDENPAVPFIVLGTADGDSVRADAKSPSEYLPDGYYLPKLPDASAVFVLARRERVDALRPFAFEDLDEPQPDVSFLNRYGIARRVWLNYLALQKTVPMPKDEGPYSSPSGRQPTGAEWLADLKEFSKKFNSPQQGAITSKLRDLIGGRPTVSQDWRPKEWFPVPWNTEQLASFDRLPTLGFLHRPVFVKMTDAEGKLLTQTEDREMALKIGWQAALTTLPSKFRSKGPSRVIVATGNKVSQLVDFHGMLRKVVDEGGEKFDPANPVQFIDVDQRLGNTGASTFFMQTAIGVLGSYREGGVTAAFNLRDTSESSIIFISPPSDERRNGQQHVLGGDVLRSATVPAVDPKNYEEF